MILKLTLIMLRRFIAMNVTLGKVTNTGISWHHQCKGSLPKYVKKKLSEVTICFAQALYPCIK